MEGYTGSFRHPLPPRKAYDPSVIHPSAPTIRLPACWIQLSGNPGLCQLGLTCLFSEQLIAESGNEGGLPLTLTTLKKPTLFPRRILQFPGRRVPPPSYEGTRSRTRGFRTSYIRNKPSHPNTHATVTRDREITFRPHSKPSRLGLRTSSSNELSVSERSPF